MTTWSIAGPTPSRCATPSILYTVCPYRIRIFVEHEHSYSHTVCPYRIHALYVVAMGVALFAHTKVGDVWRATWIVVGARVSVECESVLQCAHVFDRREIWRSTVGEEDEGREGEDARVRVDVQRVFDDDAAVFSQGVDRAREKCARALAVDAF